MSVPALGVAFERQPHYYRKNAPLTTGPKSPSTMPRSILFVFVLLALVLAACKDTFDPRTALDQKMVVFSVLSTDRDIQYVRVQTDYMPAGYDPLSYTSDNFLSDAQVTLKDASKTYLLRDTLVARSDSGRYNFPLRAFYLNRFVPQRGKSYDLIVQSPSYGQAYATIVIPDKPKITIPPEVIQYIDRPDRYAQNVAITFILQLSSLSKGYVARFLLYYDVLKGSEWVEERIEIPISSADSSSYSLDIPRYPDLAASPNTSQVGMIYRNGYYRGTLNILNEHYKDTRLIFKWATVVLLQADKNLYDYYSITHASRDPFSIRLDEPMISTVNGGLGVIGAYSLDSTVNILPENFWGNR